MQYSLKNKKVWIAGHNGMVGSAIHRNLKSNHKDCEILTTPRNTLDLTQQGEVNAWINDNTPDCIILAAAKVGGIHANSAYPAQFIYENLAIQTNIIHGAYKYSVEKLLFLGSSCIYPKNAPQPLKEEYLLTGDLEPTNEPYAIAKIAGIKMCEAYRRQYGCNFISALPTNLYGAGDNYHPQDAHVPAALIRRIHEAKQNNTDTVEIWGSGEPMREFMHVDDLADACIFLLENYNEDTPINIGTGKETSIQNFAETIADIIGFSGTFKNNLSRPDGTPRKLLDSSKLMKLGWNKTRPLKDGLKQTYQSFLEETR